MSKFKFKTVVSSDFCGMRIDQALAAMCPQHSRSRLQQWIKLGMVKLNQQYSNQRTKVYQGDEIDILAQYQDIIIDEAEAIPLAVLYEDEDLLIINKPAGLVVHPGAGNKQHTLTNALLYYDSKLACLPRAGIVHRLDKNTTGIMMIAKTPLAHTSLIKQIQAHAVIREYHAVVCGQLIAGGRIDKPIGRHPKHRIKMSVSSTGKQAITDYRLIKKYAHHSYLNISLHTGRTHQIRVHMASIHHPVLGDPTYGKLHIAGLPESLKTKLKTFKRQALHARCLTLDHPLSGIPITQEAPLPEDMLELLSWLDKADH